MTPLMIERAWPYLVTIIIVLVWWFGLGHPFPAKPDALMGASGTVAAVFVGFLGTAKAIVLGLTNSAVYRKLKSAGYANLLYHYLAEALFSGIIFLAVAVVGFFLPENQPQVWFSIVWFVTGVASLLLYVRCQSAFKFDPSSASNFGSDASLVQRRLFGTD